MTGRPPLPWWDRRQATIVATAARRAGLNAVARLDGWLEIKTDDDQSIGSAQFSQRSGALMSARGAVAGPVRQQRIFRPDSAKMITARDATDAFADWLRAGRPGDDIVTATRARIEGTASLIEQAREEVRADVTDRPLAPVTDLASRRKTR